MVLETVMSEEHSLQYVYQLVANGHMDIFGQAHTIFSSTVFQTREAAEKRIEAFTKSVTDKNKIPLQYLSPEKLEVLVKPLELLEE